MSPRETKESPVDQTGAYLRSLRENRGLTQRDLAKLAGIRQSVVSDLEMGKVGLSWYYCKVLAGAYGLAVTDLAAKTDLLPPEVVEESRSRLTSLTAEHPDLLAFLARVKSLPPDARLRFNLAMRKMVEMEEEFFDATHQQEDAPGEMGGRQS